MNIFGGIVRCDVIAEGIIRALDLTQIDIPVVVRLEGTNAKKGIEMLSSNHVNIIAASSLREAIEQAVEVAK